MQKKYKAPFQKQTGMILLSRTQTLVYVGTYDELLSHYNDVLRHNLLFGWWGLIAFFVNIVVLIKNYTVLRGLRKLVNSDQPIATV